MLKDKKTISGTGYEFVRTYDSMGRVRTLTYPDTEVVTYTYNGFGDVETISGVKSAVTTDYIKDVNYNPSGQITFTKYGNNVTSDYTYDSNTLCLNNILTKKPDGTTKLQDLSYTFDNNGNVSQISDLVNSMSQSFTYDDLNRLLTATGSAYGSQSFVYDSIGNMTSKAGRTMVYGPAGLPAGALAQAGPHAVTKVTAPYGQLPTFCNEFTSMPLAPCTMQYDANGNMTKRGSDILTYTSENYLKSMKTYEGATGSHTFTLKPGWNVISFTYLPQDKSVSSIMAGLVYGTDYDQISTWDADLGSWRHWVNDPDFNDFTTFEYGKSYEIYNKKATNITLKVTNQKSPAVNLTQNIKVGDNFISPAVKSNQTISALLGSWGLALGTHISDIKRFNSTTQVWESYAAAQFTQFEPGKGYNIIGLQNSSFNYGKTETTTTFTYDSTGARTKKVEGSVTTTYLGKDYEKISTGSVTTKHIFLGDRRITTKKSDGTIQYIHSDHINSSNVITDASGNSSGLLEYDPYGTTITSTTSAVKYKFNGKEEDVSKLYDYSARLYDPQIGRFITADPTVNEPANPQDLNRYTYVHNNPIRYTDPSGLRKRGFFEKLFGIIGAVVGLFAGDPIGGYQVGSALGRDVDRLSDGNAPWQTKVRIAAKYKPISLTDSGGGDSFDIDGGGGDSDGSGPIVIGGGDEDREKGSDPQTELIIWIIEMSTGSNKKKGTVTDTSHVHIDPVINKQVTRLRRTEALVRRPLFSGNFGGGAPIPPSLGGEVVLSSAYIMKMKVGLKTNPGREVVPDTIYSSSKEPRAKRISKAESPIWQKLKNWRKGIKRDDKGNYYRWDYTHGDIEMYDKNSKREIASLDAETGEAYREGTGHMLEL